MSKKFKDLLLPFKIYAGNKKNNPFKSNAIKVEHI